MTASANEPGIEPELRGPVPRNLRFRLGTQLARFFVALLNLGLLAGIWVVVGLEHRELDLLLRNGRTTVGRISARRKYSGKSIDRYLDYRFSANGRPYDGSEHVDEQTFDDTAVGDPLTITYLPSDPTVERVGNVDASTLAAQRKVEFLILSFLAPVFIGLTWYCENFFRRRLHLLRWGTPVRAEILRWFRPNVYRRPSYSITFAYDGPGGERITRTIAVGAQFGRALVQQKSATVLYNPQRPQESNFYLALNPAVPATGK